MMMRSAAAEEDDIKSALVPIANGSEEMEADDNYRRFKKSGSERDRGIVRG